MRELLSTLEADFFSRKDARQDLAFALGLADLPPGWTHRVANVWRQTRDDRLTHRHDPAADAAPDFLPVRWLLVAPDRDGEAWVLYWTACRHARRFRSRRDAVRWLADDFGLVPGEEGGEAA